jgi:hypothetical protein
LAWNDSILVFVYRSADVDDDPVFVSKKSQSFAIALSGSDQ